MCEENTDFIFYRPRGFTLIELVVILIIASIAAVALLTLHDEIIGVDKAKTTHEKLAKVRNALEEHVAAFGYYPCPADPELVIENVNFGIGQGSDDATDGCDGPIGNNITTVDIGTANETHIGAVPVKTLGLGIDDMMDAWDNRILYAVSQRVTTQVTLTDTPDIIILRDYDDTVMDPKPFNQPPANIINDEAAMILISMGEDAVGSYPFEGGSNRTQSHDIGAGKYVDSIFQQHNHHIYGSSTLVMDRVFFKPDEQLSNQSATVHFDDLIQWSVTYETTSVLAVAIGGIGSESTGKVLETSDNSLVVAGQTNSYGAGSKDMFLVKLDSLGVLLWSRTLGGINDEEVAAILEDGTDIVLAGYTSSFGAGGRDAFLARFDSTGAEQWSKTLGGVNDDEFHDVIVLADNSLIAAGYTMNYGSGNKDGFLVKFDSNGIEQWSKTIGGANEDVFLSLAETNDNGYVVVGYSYSYGAGGDAFIVKFNSSGVEQWSKTIGGVNEERFHDVIETSNFDIVAVGLENSYGAGATDGLLVQFDSSGIEQWSKTFGDITTDTFHAILETGGGSFYVLGITDSYGAGDYDTTLTKFTNLGSVQWSRSFGDTLEDKFAGGFVFALDGGLLAAGHTYNYGAGGQDGLLVKFDTNGHINDCSPLASTIIAETDETIAETNHILAETDHSLTETNQTLSESSNTPTITTICPIP